MAAYPRYRHKPWIITGWATPLDLLDWPRIKAQRATTGDILEVVRHNEKSRYELGEREGVKYVRALQGHSRSEVGIDDLLQELTVEIFPERILHSIQ